MKKALALLLSFAVCLSLAACGGNGSNSSTISQSTLKVSSATSSPASEQAPSSTGPASSAAQAASSKKNTSSRKPASSKTPVSGKVTAPPASSKTVAPPAEQTLESYIASIRDEIKALEDAMAGLGLNIKVTVRGNSLAYIYQFNEDLGENTEAVKAGLNQSLEEQASTFQIVLTSMKAEIPSSESVIVEYLDKSGNILASREYK